MSRNTFQGEGLPQFNLKNLLMQLGNHLVAKGFMPAAAGIDSDRSTKPIEEFTEWLNNTPEAQDILQAMSVSWPVANSRDNPVAFDLIHNGESIRADCVQAMGNKLAVKSHQKNRMISLVIGEKNVRSEQREKFRQCLRSFGCPIHLIQSGMYEGEQQDSGQQGGE